VPRFSRIARSYLLHIGNLDWTKINPDIFGSMIQAVADDDERGALGMDYTSMPNILKVLNPLFLDDLRAQLKEAGDNARMLLIRVKGRDQARQLVYCRRTKGLCCRDGRRLYKCPGSYRRTPSRDLRQWH
jgi:hypothetical protein